MKTKTPGKSFLIKAVIQFLFKSLNINNHLQRLQNNILDIILVLKLVISSVEREFVIILILNQLYCV